MSKKETVKAPYNFVPLADEVFFPDWHDQVSHDVPFEDGLSGCFDLVIEAQTPIFTRDDREFGENETQTFLEVDGTPFIKGSSIRGMLREVVKIAGYGKMDTADDQHFAFREFGNASYRQMMSDVSAGWLTPDQTIQPCKSAKISYEDLESIQKKRGNSGWRREHPMPKKYKTWKGTRRQFATITSGKNDTFANPVEASEVGSVEGTIVFTGHVDRKKREFFFYDERRDDPHRVKDDIFEKFKQVHRASQQRPEMDVAGQAPNEHWGYLKERLEDGEKIPVFYRFQDGEVTDLGLASMYRLPSKIGVHDAIKNQNKNLLDMSRFDLADLIFGYAADSDELRGSLKGRVSFTHAPLTGKPRRLPPVTAALQTPKASFYPAYLDQRNHSGQELDTWQNEEATINGWKRYPARGRADADPKCADRPDMNTDFVPLDEGSTFKARMYFHNLRPVELGALLWSLDFGARDGLVHRLGLARPYGYGEVTLRAENPDIQPNKPGAEKPRPSTLKEEFEALMEDAIGSWLVSDPIVYLLAMANPDHGRAQQLQYEPGPGEGDGFSDAKRDGAALPPPNGLEQTRRALQTVVDKQKKARQKRERQQWEAKSSREQAQTVVEVIEREEHAVSVARVIIHQQREDQPHQLKPLRYQLSDRHDQWLVDCLESPDKRRALKDALRERYYPYWSKGKVATERGLQAGSDKIKEYAAWLESDDDDDPDDDGSGGEDSGGPFGHLPDDEATQLAAIVDNAQPKNILKNFWHNDDAYKTWSADGVEAFGEVAHQVVVGDKAMRKVKRKDKNFLSDVDDFVETRLDELAKQPVTTASTSPVNRRSRSHRRSDQQGFAWNFCAYCPANPSALSPDTAGRYIAIRRLSVSNTCERRLLL